MRARCDFCGRFVDFFAAKVEVFGTLYTDPYQPDERLVCSSCASDSGSGDA